MEISVFLNIFIILICLFLTVLSIITVEKRKINLSENFDENLPKFNSPDVYFKPYPSSIDISNSLDCNVYNLKICIIGKPETLFGCKELTVRCIHFDKDTEYHENGEISVIIPKNKSELEGYALASFNSLEYLTCNPYHGDFVLILKDPEIYEYLFICLCKNPGFIGNDDIFGNCTSVYICNGQIDNIDKPLKDINCKCKITETNIKYKITENLTLPVCKKLSIQKANELYEDWFHLVPLITTRLMPIENFNKNIKQNVNCGFLLDVCRNDLTNMSREIPEASYNEKFKTCMVKNSGIPIRIDVLEKYPDNDDKLDTFDGVLSSEIYEYARFLDNVGGKRRLLTLKTKIPFNLNNFQQQQKRKKKSNDWVFIVLENVHFNTETQLIFDMRSQLLSGKCEIENLVSYSCRHEEYFWGFYLGIPVPYYKLHPSYFITKYEQWDEVEFMMDRYMKFKDDLGLQGKAIKLDVTKEAMKAYGLKFCHKNSPIQCLSGIYSFSSLHDYRKHVASITG